MPSNSSSQQSDCRLDFERLSLEILSNETLMERYTSDRRTKVERNHVTATLRPTTLGAVNTIIHTDPRPQDYLKRNKLIYNKGQEADSTRSHPSCHHTKDTRKVYIDGGANTVTHLGTHCGAVSNAESVPGRVQGPHNFAIMTHHIRSLELMSEESKRSSNQHEIHFRYEFGIHTISRRNIHTVSNPTRSYSTSCLRTT